MSNTVSMLPVDLDLLLQLVHGPVRDVLAAVLEPVANVPQDISKKLIDTRNRVLWIYTDPFSSHYATPPVYNISRPLVLWCWALAEHRNEADVCIRLLEHIDCLNNPERAFYRDIAIDLLKATSKEQLEKIHRRLCAVGESTYSAGTIIKPDWNRGKQK